MAKSFNVVLCGTAVFVDALASVFTEPGEGGIDASFGIALAVGRGSVSAGPEEVDVAVREGESCLRTLLSSDDSATNEFPLSRIALPPIEVTEAVFALSAVDGVIAVGLIRAFGPRGGLKVESSEAVRFWFSETG